MWVLSERENAEKVGYPIVWEEIKEASNVIDYQINEEITKDASGVINTNNDTTTGMATVIPWINAPKLLMWTSIYEPTPAERTVVQTMNWWVTLNYPDWPQSWGIYNFTTTSSTGKKSFVYNDWESWYKWMVAPYKWTYTFTCTYPWTSSSFTYEYRWRIAKWWYPDDITLDQYTRSYSSSDETRTFTADLAKWDAVFCWVTMIKTGAYFTDYSRVTVTITKL